MPLIPFARFTLHSSLSSEQYVNRVKVLLQKRSLPDDPILYIVKFKEAGFTVRSRCRSLFDRRSGLFCWVRLLPSTRQGTVVRVVAAEPGVLLCSIPALGMASKFCWIGNFRVAAIWASFAVVFNLFGMADFRTTMPFVRGLLEAARNDWPDFR
jgi:hypothetical protein